MTFRFIGIESHYSGGRLESFGQPVPLGETEGAALIVGNLPILPDAEFQSCGFTAEELERYKYPGPREGCTPEFAEKWKAARLALHEVRERLKAGGTLAGGGE